MIITDIRAALVEALRRIDGLTVHDFVPGVVQVLPAAVVFSPETVEYNIAMVTARRTLSTLTFNIALLVGRQNQKASQDLLENYASDEGDLSVPAALNADVTLGGVVGSLKVVRTVTGAGNYQNGTESLLGALFEIEVIA